MKNETSEIGFTKLRNFHHLQKTFRLIFQWRKDTERSNLQGKVTNSSKSGNFCLMVKSHTLTLYAFSVWACCMYAPTKKGFHFPRAASVCARSERPLWRFNHAIKNLTPL